MKLLLLLFLIPITIFSQDIPYRKYRIGKVSEYKLTSEGYRNEIFSGKTVSIARLSVVKDTGFFSEKISWLSKISFTGKDTINLDSVAQKVKPYKISLSSKGKALLPKLDIPEMVGEITDLNTFFAAIAPALNVHKLSSANPTFTNTKLIQGNFADGIMILKGGDCIEVTQTLVKTTKNYSIVKTDFFPPLSSCLDALLDTISKKIFERPNNFQMIQKSSDDKVNLLWGNESFTVITKINNRNGQILEATMTNTLNLRMRIHSSPDLKSYATEMPYTIKRNLKLELLEKK